MSGRAIETDVALVKLARALEVEPAEVEFLSHLDVNDLREIRWRINDSLAAADAKRLAGVVSASKVLPVALAAKIGEKWFGPVLCARLVGLIDPRRGGQFAEHLSLEFMADITARTDPRVVGDLVQELKVRTMQGIAGTLMSRGDHLTLSHFVGHIPARVVADVLAAIDDNAAVVRIARYVEDLEHLDPVVALLPDDRIVDLIHSVDAEDIWVDGFHLFSHLGDAQVTRIAGTIVRQDTDAVTAAIGAFDRHQLWSDALVLVERLDDAELATFTDVLLVLDDAVISSAVDAIDEGGAWDVLVRVGLAAGDLRDDVRDRLCRLIDTLPSQRIAAFNAAATSRGRPDLLDSVLGRTT